MSGAARVWRAGPADADEVARLMLAFRDWWGRGAPSEAAWHAGVRRLLADPGTEFLLAVASDAPAPAGVCQLRFRHGLWYDAEDCELEDLFVEEAGRRRGLAAALLEAALERARARGCGRVKLDANAANAPAQALYRRYGFTSWSDPPGGEDLLMRLRL